LVEFFDKVVGGASDESFRARDLAAQHFLKQLPAIGLFHLTSDVTNWGAQGNSCYLLAYLLTRGRLKSPVAVKENLLEVGSGQFRSCAVNRR